MPHEKNESLDLLARHLLTTAQPADDAAQPDRSDEPPHDRQTEDGRVQIGPTDI